MTTTPVTVADLLGCTTAKASGALTEIVEAATGERPDSAVTIETVGYPSGSPATQGLYRVSGSGWSMFVKVLQDVRHWPGLAALPPPVAAQFAREFPWRSELELWAPYVLETLPAGLRVPTLYRLVELPRDRVAVWMEDIAEAPQGWDLARFRRAAHLLGRWNARSMAPETLAASGYPPGYALRMYAERSVPMRGLRPLESDDLWAHPWLAAQQELRAELRRLGTEIPTMLDRLDTLPQCLPHGDASPQNLLVPAHGPAAFVVIDLSFRSPHAVGMDLGQLLVGLTHAGLVPTTRLPQIAEAIVPAYLVGLAAEGLDVPTTEVCDAFTTSALLRSTFDGFEYHLLDDLSPPNRAAFAERVALSRFLMSLYLDHHHGAPT